MSDCVIDKIKSDWEYPTLLTLMKSVACLVGARSNKTGDLEEKKIIKSIGECKHYVFILVDAFGYNLINRVPANGILESSFNRKISSVFPSTTAASMSSISTLKWPASHGHIEWWSYLEDYNIAAALLPYTERETVVPLNSWYDDPSQIIEENNWISKSNREMFSYIPRDISRSPFTDLSTKGSKVFSYESIGSVAREITDNIKRSKSNTYSYLYFHYIDKVSHSYGIDCDDITNLLREVDWAVKYIKESLLDKVKIVVTADHGQLNIEKHDNHIIKDDHPILDLLELPPTGGSRISFFKCLNGKKDKFLTSFKKYFGDEFELISGDDFIAEKYLGKGEVSKRSRLQVGDYVALPIGKSVMFYHPLNTLDLKINIGHHGGGTSAEMDIPLIII